MAPSKSEITTIFAHLSSGDQDTFFTHVSPTVSWTVMSHSVLGGTYNSIKSFRESTFARLGPIMDPSTPMSLKIKNIIGGGEGEEWCTVEMENEGKCKNGMEYNQRYAWCVRWEGKSIMEVRAYLDTALLRDVIEGNEK
jgi:ketosteroid isomerase-like protein